MEYPYQTPTTPDERTMALLAHVLMIVGSFIAPLVIYLIKKDQSAFVRFHALQALIWQIILHALWFVVAGIWVATFFLSVVSSGAMQHAGGAPPPAFIAGMVAIWACSACIGITNILLAVVYGVKANRGEWAQYPIIGGWARTWAHV